MLAILPLYGDESEDRGKPTITHLLIDAPPSSRSAKKGLAFGSKPSMCVGRSAAQSVVRKPLRADGAASARDPTAPSALADPGLVLVRGPDRRTSRMRGTVGS